MVHATAALNHHAPLSQAFHTQKPFWHPFTETLKRAAILHVKENSQACAEYAIQWKHKLDFWQSFLSVLLVHLMRDAQPSGENLEGL